MKHPRLRQITLVGVAGGAGLLATYLKIVRPWTMRWGATSAQQIIPDLQHLQAGDLVPMVAGKEIGPRVKELESNRRMLYAAVASTGDIVMVRKQLRGIKARAERLAAASPDPHPSAPVEVPA